MINYFLYTIISLGCSYLLYFFLLRRQKTFQFNRFFLLGSIFLCLLSPFIEFEILSSVPSITQIPVENFSELQVNNDFEDVVVGNTTTQQKSEVSFWTYAYVLVFVLFLSRFLKNLFSVFYLDLKCH